jgi:hypothetical protein
VPHAACVQQTPSTQLPFAHVAPVAQACPGQEEPLQQMPSTQEPPAHSPHAPDVLQSDAGLHGAPPDFAGWHAPLAAQ